MRASLPRGKRSCEKGKAALVFLNEGTRKFLRVIIKILAGQLLIVFKKIIK